MPHGFPSFGENEKLTAKEDVVHSDRRENEAPPELRFLHYNDVYHPDAQSEEPAGGIARFHTLASYYRDDKKFKDQVKLITVFSGDAYNPSTESAVTRGSHMVPLLNHIGTDIACAGNHDFDFGAPQFEKLRPQCNFPWVLSNVFDPSEGENVPLGHCHRTYMYHASNGVKIGFIGLAEREWAAKGNSLPLNLDYHEMVDAAKELSTELRQQGADMVIAMTHARQQRDFDFGNALPIGCVDMIFAGHDHWWEHCVFDNGTHLVRSGSDFKTLSYIRAWKKKDDKGPAKWDWEITRRYLMRSIPEDQETLDMVGKKLRQIHNRMERPIGYTVVPLDARKSTLCQRESNFANFACDLLRLYYETDCALMTGGTIKGDQVHTPGMIRLKFITDTFPFEDPVVSIKVKGKAILEALENGLHTYPEQDGIFLHVSGIRYSFNPNAKPWSRIQHVQLGDSDLDHNKEYTIACRSRMAFGQDGFKSLAMKSVGGVAEEIVSDENGLLISMIFRQYLMSLQALGGASADTFGSGMAATWGNIQAQLHQLHPVRENDKEAPSVHDPAHKENVDDYGSDDEDAPVPGTEESIEHGRKLGIMRKTLRKWRKYAGLKGDPGLPTYEEDQYNIDWTKGICPQLEGRIKMTEEPAPQT